MPFLRGVVDAICHFWRSRTPFAICGRHLPFVDATCQFREGVDAICHLWRAGGRHMPFMEGVDAICHLWRAWTPFAILGRHLPI
jgi:hypothetical protein